MLEKAIYDDVALNTLNTFADHYVGVNAIAKNGDNVIDSLDLTLDSRRSVNNAARFGLNITEDGDCKLKLRNPKNRQAIVEIYDINDRLLKKITNTSIFKVKKGFLKLCIYCIDNNECVSAINAAC